MAQACGELPGDQGDAEHQRKGEEILGVSDGKRVARLHEKEVETQHRQHRGPDARAASVTQGHQHHGEQKQHDDVGQVEHLQQQCRNGAGGETGECGPQIGQGSARCRRRFFDHRRRPRHCSVGYHDLINLRVMAADPVTDRLMPEPPRLARMVTEHQAIGVVLAGTGDQRVGDVHARQRCRVGAKLAGQGQGFHGAQIALGAAPLS